MLFQEYYEAALRRGWFDPCFYFDVLRCEGLSIRNGELSLFEHYATIGWKRGLSPSDRFAVARYLAEYRDVREKDLDPLYHFLTRGQRERRKAFALFAAPSEVQFVGVIDTFADEAQLALARANAMSAFCIRYDGGRGREVADSLDGETSFCLMFDHGGWAGDSAAAEGSPQAQYSLVHDVLEVLADPRYLRVRGKPLLVVYRPERLASPSLTFALWREVARRAGLGGAFVAGVPIDIGVAATLGLDGLIDTGGGPCEDATALPVFPGFLPERPGGEANAPELFTAWSATAVERTKGLLHRELPRLAFIDARSGWADKSLEFLAGAATERGRRALAKLRRFAEAVKASNRLPVLFLGDARQALMRRLMTSLGQGGGIECFLVVDDLFRVPAGFPLTRERAGGEAPDANWFSLGEVDGVGWSREQKAEYLAGLLRLRGDLVVVSGTLASADLLGPFAARGHRIVSFPHRPPGMLEWDARGINEIKRCAHRIIVGSESERSELGAAGAIARDDIQVVEPPSEPGQPQGWSGYVENIRQCLAGLGNDGRRIRSAGGTVGRQEIAEDLCVVIPSHNHKAFIAAALDSVLAQSVRPKEIRIIDDGSRDGSAELVRDLASDERGIFVEVRENKGAHATINQGVAETGCPIVAIMNSDDRWHPLRIENLIGELRRKEGADVVFSRLRFIGPRQKCEVKRNWYEAGVADYRTGTPLWLALMSRNFFFTTSNLIARREKFLEVGGFAALRYCHDLDYMLKAIFAGHKVEFVEQTLCDYRVHARNTIDQDIKKLLFEEAWIAAKLMRQSSGRIGEADRSVVARRIHDKGLATRVLGILRATAHNDLELDDTRIYTEPRFVAVLDEHRHQAKDAGEPGQLMQDLAQFLWVQGAEAPPPVRG